MTALTFDGELKIVTGWDNSGTVVDITTLTDTDSIPFILPMPFIGLSQGIRKPRLSRRVDVLDSKVRVWTFQAMTVKQLSFLYTTYFTVDDSKVTVRTVDYDGTYTAFNAYIVVPIEYVQMAGESLTGFGTNTPGDYNSNWLQDIPIAFNITGTAS